jgi:probable HAF family extracellular repeat protein
VKLPFPRRIKAWLVALVSLTAVTLVSIAPMTRPRAQAPPTAYTITDLGTLGGVESKAFALNSCGQVAGYATNGSSTKRPFFRPSNSLIDLGVLSGDGIANSVNNSGYVVGYSPTGTSSDRAFIWHDDNGDGDTDAGEMKDLLVGFQGSASAEDINDNGRVVGWVLADSSSTLGYESFVWENNSFQIISGSPAHPSPLFYGINNAGSIVGEDSTASRGFILRNGTFTDIPVFGTGDRSAAYAVSESDHVVGTAKLNSGASDPTHAFLWTDALGLKDLGTLAGKTHSLAYNVAIVSGSVQVVGTSYNIESDAQAFVWQDLDADGEGINDPTEMKDLLSLVSNPTDWTRLSEARSINSSGQIVGFGVKTNGETHAFLLTPATFTPSQCLPIVSVSVSPAAMNEDAAGSLTYTFTRSITTGSPLVVSFSTTGTANSSDYSISSPAGTVTIPANQQSATVTVDPVTDSVAEPNETVVLTTSPDAAYTIAAAPLNAATGTINNDDTNVSVSVAPSSVSEDGAGTGNLVYTFTRTGLTNAINVNFTLTGSTATFGSDYTQACPSCSSFTASGGTINFGSGETSKTVTVTPTLDPTDEPDEFVTLNVAAGSGYTAGSPVTAIGTIADNDGLPSISINNVTATEGNSGQSAFVFTVSLSHASSAQITVSYTTAAGTTNPATGGASCGGGIDFINTSGPLTFAAGETSKQVTVQVCGDTNVEANETFFVNLSGNSANSVLSAGTGTGTITNDDTNVSVAVSPASVSEDGATNLVYTFTRTGVTTGTLAVNFSVGGTATFSTDYAQTGATSFTPPTGSVSFASGETVKQITVNPTTDSAVEPDETVVLTVTSSTGYNVGSPSVATGTITNDDTNVSVAVSPASVAEDGSTDLVYTFTRTGVTSGPLTVNFSVGGGSNPATFSSDYAQTGATSFTASGGTINFLSGETAKQITVNPTTDSAVEPDETVVLTVTSSTGYNVGSPSVATGTITNDDTNVSVAVSPASVAEDGPTNLTYTFTRTGLTNAITVNFSVTGSTATLADFDYTTSGATSFTSSGGTINFLSGETAKQITVNPTSDAIDEPNETVILTVTSGTGYTVGSPSAATGTITDDEGLPTISIDDVTAVEGNSGPSAFVFTVSLSNASSSSVTVNYQTAAGSTNPATGGAGPNCGAAGVDFITTSAGLTFAAGETSKQVSVTVCGDNNVEPDETFFVTLSGNSPNSNLPANTKGTGTITNEDTDVTISVSPPSVTETGAANLVYTFTRTGVITGALTVNFSVGGTAILADYSQTGAATFSASAGTVTLPAGISFATVSLDPTPDSDVESAENVILTVAAGTGYTVSSPSAATGTITDAPVIYVEEGTENSPTPTAAAVDAVTFARGPFQLTNNNNLSNDHASATRIMIFTSNLGMTNANLASGILTVRFNGSAIPPANIEHVGPVGVLGGSYIIVKLPATLPIGPNTLTVTLAGVESNATTLSIIPTP